MNKTVLITGGAGFIGSHVTDKLIASGYQVRIYDNLDEQVHGDLKTRREWPDYVNPAAELILGDILDSEKLRQALDGVHYVLHLAAAVGVGQSMYQIDKYTEVNSTGTARLLDIIINDEAIRANVEKILVASSMSNYGEGQYICPTHGDVAPPLRPLSQLAEKQWELTCPINDCHHIVTPVPTAEAKPMHPNSVYAITKKSQEELVMNVGEAYGITTIALRFFNTYGSRQALSNPYTGVAAIFSNRVLNNKPPLINEDGNQTRDFVHIDDLTQGIIIALEKSDSQILNVGSGQPVTIRDVANEIIQASGADLEPEIVERYRFGDIRHCYADISKLQSLGYQPKYSLQEGIAELVVWLREQKKAADQYESADATLRKRGLSF